MLLIPTDFYTPSHKNNATNSSCPNAPCPSLAHTAFFPWELKSTDNTNRGTSEDEGTGAPRIIQRQIYRGTTTDTKSVNIQKHTSVNPENLVPSGLTLFLHCIWNKATMVYGITYRAYWAKKRTQRERHSAEYLHFWHKHVQTYTSTPFKKEGYAKQHLRQQTDPGAVPFSSL